MWIASGSEASAPGSGEAGGVEAADMAEAAGPHDPKHEWHAGKPRMVNVVGMREGGGGELSDCNSKDLSMLVRLQGPEALAEVHTGVLVLRPLSSARACAQL